MLSCLSTSTRAWSLLAPLLLASSVHAEDRPLLSVYTYDSFTAEWGPGPRLREAFEAQCNCTLRFVSAEDGVSILNRLRLEGERTEADVVLGLDEALMTETRALGHLQPHGLSLEGLKPGLDWADPDFVPFDYGYFAFIHDTERTPEPARSLRELLASNARVIYQDPRTSTPGQGLLLWMETVYGADVEAAWKALAERTVTVTQGWSEAYQLFLEGESDYVLSYTTSPAYHVVAEGSDRYRAATFSEGHVAQIEVAAMTRHTGEPALAKQFLQFLISPEAQAILPVTNWMLPVIEGVELPAVFATAEVKSRLRPDLKRFAEERQTWIRRWRNAVSR